MINCTRLTHLLLFTSLQSSMTSLQHNQFQDDPFDPNEFNITDANLTRFRDVSCVWGHKPIEEIVWKSIIVLLIVAVGLIGNFTVIFLVLKRPKIRQQPVNIFIVNLAVADFLTTLFTPIVSLFINVFQNFELGPVMCKLDIFIKMMCILASIFSVIAISFERFQNISHLTSAPSSRFIKWRIVIKLILVWSASIGLSMPLAMWRVYQERQWTDYVEKWCTDDPAEYAKNYWIFLLSPLIYFPLILMVITYSWMAIKIGRFIREMQQRPIYFNDSSQTASTNVVHGSSDTFEMNDLSRPNDSNHSTLEKNKPTSLSIYESKYSSHMRDFNPFHANNLQALQNAKLSANNHKRSIMITVLVYALITIIFWTPLQVLVYYRAFKLKREQLPAWYEPTKFIAQLLCSINSAINPFITFRRTFVQIYRQSRHKKQQQKLIKNLKKKNFVISPPTVKPSPPNNRIINNGNIPHHHQNGVTRSPGSTSIGSYPELPHDDESYNGHPIPYPNGTSPISSTSGTPSRRAASLSKQVLMKYSPGYFDV